MAGATEPSNSSPEARDENEETINGPLVFQCGTCQTIVGDSFSLIEAVQELDVIVLRVLLQVRCDRSKSDESGVYQPVRCKHCSGLLGKKYSSISSSEFQVVLNLFSLDRSRIKSYELGCGDQEAMMEAANYQEAAANGSSSKQNGSNNSSSGTAGSSSAEMQAVLQAVQGVQTDVARIKSMSLLFDERLRSIEDLVLPQSAAPDPAPSGKRAAAAAPTTAGRKRTRAGK